MNLDLTTAELFVRIAVTIFLIVIPVVFLFQQQFPYVMELLNTLRNIWLPVVDKARSFRNKMGNRVWDSMWDNEQTITEMATEFDEITDPFANDPAPKLAEQEQSVNEDISMYDAEIAIEKLRAQELDTGERWVIDVDAMMHDESAANTAEDDALSWKQQQDLEWIKFAALSHKERGKLDLYEKKLIEGLAIDANNSDLLKLLGDHYFESGNILKALTILKKIINEESDNHKAIWQVAQIYLSQNQHDTAQLLVEKAIELKPDNPKYHITMVEIFYANKQLKSAIKSMENVLKLRPTNKNYMLTLAGLHEEIGEPTKAKAYYKKILQIDPSNEVAKRALKRLSFK